MANETTTQVNRLSKEETQSRFAAARAKRAEREGINTVSVADLDRKTDFTTPAPVRSPFADGFLNEQVPDVAEPTQVTQPETFAGLSPEALTEFTQQQELFKRLGGQEIFDTAQKILQKGTRTAELEAEGAIGEKTTLLSESVSKIRETQARFARERETLELAPGLNAAQKQAALNQQGREQARELADLSIIEATQRDDLSTAQSLVDRKVQLEFEPLEQALKFQQFFFEQNKDIFNKLETREFEKKQAEAQVEIDKDKFKFQQTENFKMDLLKNAQLNGASAGVLESILKAETTSEATLAAGNFGVDTESRLSIALLRAKLNEATIKSNEASRAVAAGELTDAQSDKADELRSEINSNPAFKDAIGLEGNTAALMASLNRGDGIGDIAAINAFQRLAVDPGVAVREGDVALLQSAQSFGDRAGLKARGLFVGNKLTEEAREQMRALASDIYTARVGFVTDRTSQIRVSAKEKGIDFNKYIANEFKSIDEINSGLAIIQQEDADNAFNSIDLGQSTIFDINTGTFTLPTTNNQF